MLTLSELKPDSDGNVFVKSGEKCKIKFMGVMPYRKALIHVIEGSCEVIDTYTVVKLYNKKQIRKIVIERDKGICHYCGKKGNTVDHKVPKSKGGCTTPLNLVCACKKCNEDKKDRSYEEYINSSN